jgi:hypothetical protein
MITETGEALYHVLLNLVLREKGLGALATAFSSVVNSTIVILDSEFNLLASSDESTTHTYEKLKARLLEKNPYFCNQGRIVELDDVQCLSCFLQPVQAGTEIFGYLCILDGQRHPGYLLP